MISMSNYNQKANSTITIVKFKGSIGKNFHFPIDFHFRLAVSKWIAPRSFSKGGVLGYNIIDNSNMIVLVFISVS